MKRMASSLVTVTTAGAVSELTRADGPASAL